jgi:hypothetical protein
VKSSNSKNHGYGGTSTGAWNGSSETFPHLGRGGGQAWPEGRGPTATPANEIHDATGICRAEDPRKQLLTLPEDALIPPKMLTRRAAGSRVAGRPRRR